MYHGILSRPLPVSDYCFITESEFRRQMQYLASYCRVLSLAEALEGLRHGCLEEASVAITFDDGYQSTFDIAFPILREFRFPATVFLNTAFVESSTHAPWFCHLIQALLETRKSSLRWGKFTFNLSTSHAKSLASKRLQRELKKLPHSELLEQLDLLTNELSVDNPVPELPTAFRILNRNAITVMSESGLIQFGAHTTCHSILTQVALAQAYKEIQNSIEAVSEMTGQQCTLFSYPNGRSTDYNPQVLSILRNLGIAAAVTTLRGPNTARTPALELRRYGVRPGLSIAAFQLKIHHLLGGWRI